MLAVLFAEFERDILRDRVKAGIAQARRDGKPHGRTPTVQQSADQIRALHKDGVGEQKRGFCRVKELFAKNAFSSSDGILVS
jgi:DNA invertase Pin-like site-specific DNA recombinase